MTDHEFVVAFESCALPLDSFHHADHVRMAFVYLKRYPLLEAIQRFSADLARFAAAHGKSNLYHETITWAYMLIIQERLARDERPVSWSEFTAGNEDLLDWNDGILKKYYRAETLQSEFAKATFVFPDRISG
jgi:hypothetical protein